LALVKEAGIVLCTLLLTDIGFGEVLGGNSKAEQTALQN